MFEHVSRYPSMLKILEYRNARHLVAMVNSKIVGPCEDLVHQLSDRLRETRTTLS